MMLEDAGAAPPSPPCTHTSSHALTHLHVTAAPRGTLKESRESSAVFPGTLLLLLLLLFLCMHGAHLRGSLDFDALANAALLLRGVVVDAFDLLRGQNSAVKRV